MNNYIKIIASVGAILVSNLLLAQGAPPATPIDGGLSLLLVAGGAYAIGQIKKRKG